MPIGIQTVLVVITVAAAAAYVVRGFLPHKRATPGCGSCPANPNRSDDYT
jgi:hypothetical protein